MSKLPGYYYHEIHFKGKPRDPDKVYQTCHELLKTEPVPVTELEFTPEGTLSFYTPNEIPKLFYRLLLEHEDEETVIAWASGTWGESSGVAFRDGDEVHLYLFPEDTFLSGMIHSLLYERQSYPVSYLETVREGIQGFDGLDLLSKDAEIAAQARIIQNMRNYIAIDEEARMYEDLLEVNRDGFSVREVAALVMTHPDYGYEVI